MTKDELIKVVSSDTGVQQDVIRTVIEQTVDVIKKTVIDGDSVTLRLFGTFEPKLRKGKIGRNPSTKEECVIPDMTIPFFRASKEFKKECIEAHKKELT